jgi:uncharacterized membrane protein (UPF0182 family)
VQKTKVTNSFGLNIYDIIYHEKLVISKAAVEELNDLLDPKREGVKEEKTASIEKPKAKKAAEPKAKKEAAETVEKKPRKAPAKKAVEDEGDILEIGKEGDDK